MTLYHTSEALVGDCLGKGEEVGVLTSSIEFPESPGFSVVSPLVEDIEPEYLASGLVVIELEGEVVGLLDPMISRLVGDDGLADVLQAAEVGVRHRLVDVVSDADDFLILVVDVVLKLTRMVEDQLPEVAFSLPFELAVQPVLLLRLIPEPTDELLMRPLIATNVDSRRERTRPSWRRRILGSNKGKCCHKKKKT